VAANVEQKSLRLIDANFNRVKEGLRVCEDIFRFIYDDRRLTEAFKRLRHDCSKLVLEFPVSYRKLVESRASNRDVGKNGTIQDRANPKWPDIVTSNIKRAEEGLRVLEEASKVIQFPKGRKFESIRFKLYELEKRTLKKL
jgi:hypothetical protein